MGDMLKFGFVNVIAMCDYFFLYTAAFTAKNKQPAKRRWKENVISLYR